MCYIVHHMSHITRKGPLDVGGVATFRCACPSLQPNQFWFNYACIAKTYRYFMRSVKAARKYRLVGVFTSHTCWKVSFLRMWPIQATSQENQGPVIVSLMSLLSINWLTFSAELISNTDIFMSKKKKCE